MGTSMRMTPERVEQETVSASFFSSSPNDYSLGISVATRKLAYVTLILI
jgi:hypothetical protein